MPLLILHYGTMSEGFEPTESMVIGRDAGCDLTLNVEGISRRHARLRFVAGRLVIEDLNSRNGTRVNGRPIVQPQVVQPGDTIHLGGRIRLTCADQAAAKRYGQRQQGPRQLAFRCPGCRELLRAPPSAAGTMSHCQACRTRFVVPHKGGGTAQPLTAPQPSQAQPRVAHPAPPHQRFRPAAASPPHRPERSLDLPKTAETAVPGNAVSSHQPVAGAEQTPAMPTDSAPPPKERDPLRQYSLPAEVEFVAAVDVAGEPHALTTADPSDPSFSVAGDTQQQPLLPGPPPAPAEHETDLAGVGQYPADLRSPASTDGFKDTAGNPDLREPGVGSDLPRADESIHEPEVVARPPLVSPDVTLVHLRPVDSLTATSTLDADSTAQQVRSRSDGAGQVDPEPDRPDARPAESDRVTPASEPGLSTPCGPPATAEVLVAPLNQPAESVEAHNVDRDWWDNAVIVNGVSDATPATSDLPDTVPAEQAVCAVCDRPFTAGDAQAYRQCACPTCGQHYHRVCWLWNRGCLDPSCPPADLGVSGDPVPPAGPLPHGVGAFKLWWRRWLASKEPAYVTRSWDLFLLTGSLLAFGLGVVIGGVTRPYWLGITAAAAPNALVLLVAAAYKVKYRRRFATGLFGLILTLALAGIAAGIAVAGE